MFAVTYAAHELRRRFGRTILTALGLAAGVGLVIGIVGVSDGLDQAQGKVLAPLQSVGTDVLVTRVAGTTTGDQAAQGNDGANGGARGQGGQGGQGGGGGFFFGGGGGGGAGVAGGQGGQGGPGGPGGALNQADALALANENRSVTTDLAKLGKPGDKFVHDFFVPGTQISFPGEAVAQASKLPGVSSAVGGLSLEASHQTGTVPQIVAELQTGGEQVTQTVMPAPLTDAERQQVRTCIAAEGGAQGGAAQTAPTPGGGGARDGGGGGGFLGRGGGRFEQCLPQRFQQYAATFTTPLRTVRQALNPPSTDIQSTPYTAAGVDTSRPDEGLVTRNQLTDGQWFTPNTTDQVLLNVSYANQNNLKVGSELPINGTTFHVVGLVTPTLRGQEAGVYFPLPALQQLSDKAGRVNVLLVKAKDAGSVEGVAAALKKDFPGAQVVTTKELADQVTGSLKDAKNLADRLGGALAVIVLGAAFVIAILLTLASVAKRVREIGTLRAIGWSKTMVVRQMLTETFGIGLLGAALGIVFGFLVIAAIGAASPSLTTSQPVVPSAAASSLGRLLGRTTQVTGGNTTIHLDAVVNATTLLLGVAFALIGGLLAGAVGGWRAARLRPARALADIG